MRNEHARVSFDKVPPLLTYIHTYIYTHIYILQFFSELPFHLISPLVLGTIVYWLANLRPEVGRFFVFMGIITLESIAAVALGMAIR